MSASETLVEQNLYLVRRWPDIVRAVALLDRRLAAVLRSCRARVDQADHAVVRLEVPYLFYLRRAEAPEVRRFVAAVLSKELRRPVRVEVELMRPVDAAEPERVREVRQRHIARIAAASAHLLLTDPAQLDQAGPDLLRALRETASYEPLGAGRGALVALADDGTYDVLLEVDERDRPVRLIVDLDGSLAAGRG